MKKEPIYSVLIFTLFLFTIQPVIQNSLSAQITLTESSYAPLLNSTADITAFSFEDQNSAISLIEQSGENQTWDLSTLANQDSISATGTIQFFTSYDGKPGADDAHFANANVMTQADFESSIEFDGSTIMIQQTVHSYSSLADSGLVEYGIVSTSSVSSGETIVRNTPAKTVYPFPLTYETSWNYSYISETSQSGGSSSSTEFTVNAEVDGYGEVQLGNTTVPVLKVLETETNTINGLLFTTISARFITDSGFEIANSSIDLDPFFDGYQSDTGEIQLILDNRLITTSTETVSETPRYISLNQNYPNPFNPSTQITYQLDKPTDVTLSVYSLTGQKVGTLVDGELMQAGQHMLSFDAGNLASGVYIYRMQAGNQSFTRKMTLLK